MTFLELCQRLGRESGTVGGDTLPSTVVSQSGRLRLIVDEVAEAWIFIQNARPGWRWMRAEGTFQTASGTAAYDGSTLLRFGEWVWRPRGASGVTAWLTADGQAGEGHLTYVDVAQFRDLTRGAGLSGPPSIFTVDEAGQMLLTPTPDAAYTIRTLYRKTPQTLAADADVPECPARHHDLIWRLALERLDMHDEAQATMLPRNLVISAAWSALENEQLPRMAML